MWKLRICGIDNKWSHRTKWNHQEEGIVKYKCIWGWITRDCSILCLGRKKQFIAGAAKDIKEKSRRGDGKFTSYFYVLFFFSHICWYITWHPYLSYCLHLTTSLFSSLDGYRCTNCCFLSALFSCEKSVIISLEYQKCVFSSMWFNWLAQRKKESCKLLKLCIFHPIQQKALLLLLFEFYSCCTLSQQDGPTLRILLHLLYGEGNLHFLLCDLMNSCGNVQSKRMLPFMIQAAKQQTPLSFDLFVLDLWIHVFILDPLTVRMPYYWW